MKDTLEESRPLLTGHWGFPWWIRVGPLAVHWTRRGMVWWYWRGGDIHIIRQGSEGKYHCSECGLLLEECWSKRWFWKKCYYHNAR
jgi:hypothetical protein